MGNKRVVNTLSLGLLAGIFSLLGVIVGRWISTAWTASLQDVRRDMKSFIRAEVSTQLASRNQYGVRTDD